MTFESLRHAKRVEAIRHYGDPEAPGGGQTAEELVRESGLSLSRCGVNNDHALACKSPVDLLQELVTFDRETSG
jgi:hypothetical protein